MLRVLRTFRASPRLVYNSRRTISITHVNRNLLKLQNCKSYSPRKPCSLSRQFHVSRILFEDEVIAKVPAFAESVSEGDIRWEKAVGDTVQEDEPVGEVETDKTSVPVLAPCSGVITKLLVGDGEKVVAHQEIFKINPSSEGAIPAKEEVTSSPAEVPEEQKPKDEPSAKPQSPSPKVAPGQSLKVVKPPVDPASLKLGSFAEVTPMGSRGEERVKMNRMRLRIAQRLKEAQNTCAMLTTFNEVDMSSIFELRNLNKDAFLKKHNVKLGFMSAFCKGSAYALKEMPVVNAVIDGPEIVYRDYIDISVAVSSPKGLVVPVLRNVESMSFADIEKGISALGQKAQTGTLAVEDMDGGTFTISNGGVFGSMFGTPIINPPQSAILGMHASIDRPVVRNGQVVIRPMMYLALTYDHRLVDGREAVTFLRKIKAFIEDPRIFFLDL